MRLLSKKAIRSQLQESTCHWLMIQVRLYAVPYKGQANKARLLNTFATAIKAGKCKNLSPDAEAMKDYLRPQFDALMKDYITAFERRKFTEFERLNDPRSEIQYDVGYFLAKYFLDGPKGRPCRNKTKDPLVLDIEAPPNLAEAIKDIPGLVFRASRSKLLLIIGWITEMDRAIEKEFANLSSNDMPELIPTMEANLDFKRFLKKHFHIDVDDSGTVATYEQKPSAAVHLYPAFENMHLLRDIFMRVPGFHVQCVDHTHEVIAYLGIIEGAMVMVLSNSDELFRKKQRKRGGGDELDNASNDVRPMGIPTEVSGSSGTLVSEKRKPVSTNDPWRVPAA
ncbi:hypothetical protein PT974_03806 [Cladobotryum mycophilum]|uniref:HNH nuclease domain-containing protein n=1 Tax=Cladobotryum mycophilum TaxID=491253 RepID=A0ABR0STZ1_9HYPO